MPTRDLVKYLRRVSRRQTDQGTGFCSVSKCFHQVWKNHRHRSEPPGIVFPLCRQLLSVRLGATDGRRRGCCVAEMMMMIMMMPIILLLLPKLRLLSFVLLLGLPFAVLRSNNYSVDPISRSVLFKTTQFFHPRISRSSPIKKPHPPTRFYCPPQYKISKNVVFTPKLTLFTDFRPFFARNEVKYEPISKWFPLSDSLQQALQHCRAKFVATQLRCMKIIIETFLRDIRFPCVSSVVFEAITIWISRHVLARPTEQFDTMHDFLG